MTEANDKLFSMLKRGNNMEGSLAKFPGVNAQGERPVESTPGGGNDTREGSLGGMNATGIMGKGRFGGSGGFDSKVLTPSIKRRSNSRRLSSNR